MTVYTKYKALQENEDGVQTIRIGYIRNKISTYEVSNNICNRIYCYKTLRLNIDVIFHVFITLCCHNMWLLYIVGCDKLVDVNTSLHVA